MKRKLVGALSVGFSIQEETMDVVWSARQRAHYHVDVSNLPPLLVVKKEAWNLGQHSELGQHQLGS